MRILLIILSLTFLGCSPFISKDLRRKNKCNRKLDRVVKTCPELLKHDTTIVNFDTTIVTKEVRVDTLVNSKFDTIEIIKDKFHVKIVNLIDSFYIQGGCDSDTIYIDKIIKVPYNKVGPIKLTIIDHIMNGFNKFWWWLIILAVLYFILRRLIKF